MLEIRSGSGFFRKMKNRKFFMQLILTTVLIAVIPNLLTNIIAYYNVNAAFKKETGQNKLQYLNQTINAIEISLNRIKENSNLLVLNRSIQTFEAYPNGIYYERLQGEIPPQDLTALYWYLQAKENAFLTIKYFKLSNEFVDSVYFYDSSKDLILTSEQDNSNLQFTKEDFYDKGWYAMLNETKDNPVFMDTRDVSLYDNGTKKVLSIIYKSTKGQNAFIVNLDADLIYSKIFHKLNRPDDIEVISSTGNVIFQSESPAIWQELLGKQSLASKIGAFTATYQGRKMLVSYSASSLLNWMFVNVSDMRTFTKGTASIKRTIILSAGILILLSVALAYLSSKRLYKPISYLYAITLGKMEPKSGHFDEFQKIGSFVRSTIDERDFYKQKLDESLPFHRERFKNSLLQGHSLSMEEIEEMQHYLSLEIGVRDLVVLLLSLDEWQRWNESRDAISGGFIQNQGDGYHRTASHIQDPLLYG